MNGQAGGAGQAGGGQDDTEAAASGTGSRYDEMAGGYERFWAPVLRVAAERVLDHLAPELDGRDDARLLDVGTGTGTLAISDTMVPYQVTV